MNITLFLLILAIFCQNAVTAQEKLQINKLILDLTIPLDELIDEEISQQDFLSDIHSAFKLIDGNVNTSTLFYETVTNTIEELESQTEAACKIIHETLDLSSGSQLLILWTIDNASFKFNASRRYNKKCDEKLFLRFNDGIECDWIQSGIADTLKKLFDSKTGMFHGISYDESRGGCYQLNIWKQYASMAIVNLKFGSTTGVPESFGLFQSRMHFSYKTMNVYDHNKQFVYYPNPLSVGEEEHKKLLIQYASIWTPSNNMGSIVVQVPNSRYKTSATTQFSLIPKFTRSSFDVRYPKDERIPSLLLFSASFKQPQMILAEEYTWRLWNNIPNESIQALRMRNMSLSIDVALDCPMYVCDYLNSNSYQPSLLNADQSRIIVVHLEEEGLPILPEIASQISPKVVVGCNYRRSRYEPFQNLNESNVDFVVNACQSINGSVYILTATIVLEWPKELENYPFYFENTIREELHAVNWFRKEILERVPGAKVFFELDLAEGYSRDLYTLKSSSLYCDELNPTINLYLEGILNWAKLENFPVIKNIYNIETTSLLPQWFKFLRRLNYPYPDWNLEEMEGDELQSSSVVRSPAFLMQGYLKSIHDWEPDACIDWTEKRWEITTDFFHNSKIGTAFYPNSILQNQTLSEGEYVTMLNFISYRFRLVEISLSVDFQNVITAVEHKIRSGDFNVEIFMNYAIPDADSKEDFPAFLTQLKNSKTWETGLLKGVHVELVVESYLLDNEPVFKTTNFDTVLSMMKYAKLSNLTCGIELDSVKICNQILEKFLFGNAYKDLISTVDYFVCKEHFVALMRVPSKTELQSTLDSHLALKRTVHQMVPHLRVYFRVEFDFEIPENNAELDKYSSFLALFKIFGAKYDIGYFVGVAFDGQLLSKQNGWWGVQNYSDLTNPNSFVEKVTVLRGQEMWYPPVSPSSPSITVKDSQDSSLVIIVSTVSSAFLFLLVLVVLCGGLRYRKLHHLSRLLSDSEVQEFLNGRVSAKTEATGMELESAALDHMKFNQEYKLDFSDITIDFEKILGTGAFGMVYKGLTKNTPAAVKRPNADCSKTTFKSVLTEVKVLSYVGNHPNVVGFLGAYIDEIHKGVLYISTELCSGGSLEAFLRKKSKVISRTADTQNANIKLESSEVDIHELNTFAKEIAQGMEYIESRRVVHGDLATRNVLLDDNLVCKIGDFGLSRKLYEYQKYVKTSQEPLPWKWMAHESLTKMEFTSKSDVWSFGVTLWEIYSLGKIPYAGLNWSVDFSKDLQNGLRLTIPDSTPENIFYKVLECWNLNPDERPTFADFVNFYKNLGESSYLVLDLAE